MPTLTDERPEALLKSALEKIVYFEARSEGLNNDLAAARAEIERLKVELAGAAQREIELRRHTAELEVRVQRAHSEREELARVNEVMRTERASLIGKLVEASRVHQTGRPISDDDPKLDLASFISELRNEVLEKRAAQAQVGMRPVPRPEPVRASSPPPPPAVVQEPKAAAPVPASPEDERAPTSESLTQYATMLASQGRLHVSHDQVLELSTRGNPLAGRTEETLFGFSVRELSAPDPGARVRAAERLKALGHSAAAPALAAALHAETDAKVQVALLTTFATFATHEGVSIVAPLLESRVPEVRIAALKALIALDPSQAGPHLAAALRDPDRAVRRRASLLALGLRGEDGLKLGEDAAKDSDHEVRALAALVLGASGGAKARALLLPMLRDESRRVREAAAQSLTRVLGTDVSSVVAMDDAQRRREVRRLSTLPAKPLTQPIAAPPKPQPAPVATAVARPQARVATLEAPKGAAALTEQQCAALLVEVRSTIRGRTPAELAQMTGLSLERVSQAVEHLTARGQLVRRGMKVFAA